MSLRRAACDPEGGPFAPATGSIVASNGHLQAAMLAALAKLAG